MHLTTRRYSQITRNFLQNTLPVQFLFRRNSGYTFISSEHADTLTLSQVYILPNFRGRGQVGVTGAGAWQQSAVHDKFIFSGVRTNILFGASGEHHSSLSTETSNPVSVIPALLLPIWDHQHEPLLPESRAACWSLCPFH